MNLLRLDQVDIGASDTVFRQSPAHGLLALGSFAAAAVVVAITGMAGVIPWPLAGFTIAVLACFALAAGIMASRSSRPNNWLLAVDGRRLLVNLRSYMNPSFPVSEPCVVELSASDVLGFRTVTERATGYDAANDAKQGDTVFLDIVMASHVQVVGIAERLQVERGLRNRGGAWRHYPVTVPDRATLRIEWRGRHARVEPGIETAILVLASVAAPLPPASETIDFGTPARRPNNADTDRDVRALAHQGRIVEATLLAVRSLNLSTTEARRYVDQRLGANMLPRSSSLDESRATVDRECTVSPTRMKLEDLSVEVLDHLIRDVFLPVVNTAAQLDRDRQLAVATVQAYADLQNTPQRERVLSAQVGRSVMPNYVSLREHYARNRQEIEAWISIRGPDLADALNAGIDVGNADLLYQDPDVIRNFVLACERQLTCMSARFRELTF